MPSFIEHVKKKYDEREDKGNMFGIGISDKEFVDFAIEYLLGPDWHVADPLGRTQINEIALKQILEKHSNRYNKERRLFNRKSRTGN